MALLAALVIAAAGSLYLERKHLFDVADAAVLAAADSFDLRAITLSGADAAGADAADADVTADITAVVDTGVDPQRATAAAAAVVRRVAGEDARLAGVRILPEGIAVTITGTWRAPFGTDLLAVDVPISVTASATVHLD